MEVRTTIRIFDADTFMPAGSIEIYDEKQWKLVDVANEQLLECSKHLPLKGILHMLISMNLVYDIIPSDGETNGVNTDAR